MFRKRKEENQKLIGYIEVLEEALALVPIEKIEERHLWVPSNETIMKIKYAKTLKHLFQEGKLK